MVRGVVREWYHEEGWGVIDSPETPGGCWAHFACIDVTGYRSAIVGEEVDLVWERADQDGYRFRAVRLLPESMRHRPPYVQTDAESPAGAYTSTVSLTFDEEPHPQASRGARLLGDPAEGSGPADG